VTTAHQTEFEVPVIGAAMAGISSAADLACDGKAVALLDMRDELAAARPRAAALSS
jgi:2-polyprenyl-6-methoxyphenol hydroxylase-like FAD-dependent oxidoreductase